MKKTLTPEEIRKELDRLYFDIQREKQRKAEKKKIRRIQHDI